MQLIKSTYGIALAVDPRILTIEKLNTLAGSSLNRKRYSKKIDTDSIAVLLEKPLIKEILRIPEREPRIMSNRTKSKIRKKVMAMMRVEKNLKFLTLTFANLMDDETAIKILQAFLDNVNKSVKDFQYLWVAERQIKNIIFPDNIHFHIIHNKFLNIKKWRKYWIELQAKYNIHPRNKDFFPSSSFDVRIVNSKSIGRLNSYLTKYVTKNASQFKCQPWNCSRKVSMLYTDMYTDIEFIRTLELLDKEKSLGGKYSVYSSQFYNLHRFPINETTISFFIKMELANIEIWKSDCTKAKNGKKGGNHV